MERISRALEPARTQREGRLGVIGEIARSEPAFDAASLELPIDRNDADTSPADERRATTEFGDTLVHRLKVVEIDAASRDRERILPPGSPGAAGAPYKMLRTQVLKRLEQLGANTLAVMSPTAGAGKTLTAINLAIAISSDPACTALLVDFDLRNPNIHRRFGYRPEIGVEECLQSRRPVHEAMFKVAGYDRLTVLGARERVEHSSELLRSQRVAEVMMEIRTRYANRILVFDLPPVLQADDALAFSKFVQAGLLVVGEGRSKREDVARSIELLHELPIVGSVLNGSRSDSATHY